MKRNCEAKRRNGGSRKEPYYYQSAGISACLIVCIVLCIFTAALAFFCC